MASSTSKALPSFTRSSRSSGNGPLSPAQRKQAAAKAAATRKGQQHKVIINGKPATVNGSQLAGLKAAASKANNGTAKKAAAKAQATRKANKAAQAS